MSKFKLLKKTMSMALAATMVVTSIPSVYATDDVPATETMTEAATDGSTEDPIETESETESEPETDEYTPYIIMLPTDGFSYSYDEQYFDEELSTDDYDILLYEEGDKVEFTVASEKDFKIVEDDLETLFLDGMSSYSFDMPAKDLVLIEKSEDPTDDETDVTEAMADTGSEAATETIPDGTEPVTDAADTEAATTSETEAPTEEVQTDATVETEAASETDTTPDTEADPETEDSTSASEINQGGTYIDFAFPENGATERQDTQAVPRDGSMDPKDYKFYSEESVTIQYVSGEMGEEDDTEYLYTYSCSLVSDPEHTWILEIPFIWEPVTDETDVQPATEGSASFPIEYTNTEGYDGKIPDTPGAFISGPEYTVNLDDESFFLGGLSLGYDPILYNRKVLDDGGFDIHTEGTYVVRFEVTHVAYAEYAWTVECVINVKAAAEDGVNRVHLESSKLEAVVTDSEGNNTSVSFGSDGLVVNPITTITVVKKTSSEELNPIVTVTKNGSAVDTAVSVNALSDSEASIQIDGLDGTGYTISIKNAASETFSPQKDSHGWLSSVYAEHIVSIDGYEITFDEVIGNETFNLAEDDTDDLYEKYGTDEELYLRTEAGLLEDTAAVYSVESSDGEVAEDVAEPDAVDAATATSMSKVSKTFSNAGTFSGTNWVNNYANNDFEHPVGSGYDAGYVVLSSSAKSSILSWAKGEVEAAGFDWPSDFSIGNIYVQCCRAGLWAIPNNVSGWNVTATVWVTTSGVLRVKLYSYKQYGSVYSYQALAGSSVYKKKTQATEVTGSLVLNKTLGRPELAEIGDIGISAQFLIYDNASCSGDEIATAEFDDSTTSVTIDDLEEGTYYIKEANGSMYCRDNETIYKAVVKAGETTKTLTVHSGDSTTLRGSNTIANMPSYHSGLILKKTDDQGKALADAIYKVYYNNIKGERKAYWYFKTDSNGQIKFDSAHLVSEFKGDKSSDLPALSDGTPALPTGFLTFAEVQAPTGYELSYDVTQVWMKATGANKLEYNVPTVVDEPLVAKIAIQKYVDAAKTDSNPISDEYSFEGAEYSVYTTEDASGEAVAVIKIDASGKGKSGELETKYGGTKYYVKETKAPNCGAYELDPNIYPVVLYSEQTVTVKSYDKPTGGSAQITVQKYIDEDKKTSTPLSSKYSFEGAEYGVYTTADASGEPVDIIEIGASGNGSSKELEVEYSGTQYYVKEITAPTCGAYELDTTIYPVLLKKDSGINIVKSYEAPKTGKVTVHKILQGYEGVDEIAYAKEQGYFDNIVFILTHENADELENWTGQKKIELNGADTKTETGFVCGTWTVTETGAPEGYLNMDPFTIEITPETLEQDAGYGMDLKNVKDTVSVQISKKDADSGNVITTDEATFKITDADGKDVTVTLPDGTETVEFQTQNGVMKFSNSFDVGTYHLVELKAPAGYELMDAIEFTASRSSGNLVNVTFSDEPIKKKVSITKVDAATGNRCGAGFVYNIVAAEDIKDGSGTVRTGMAAGSVVGTMTTDANGTATSQELYLGKYYIQEASINDDGYTLNNEMYNFELKADSSQADTVTIQTSNKPFTLTILKTDALDNGVMAGVTFRIKEKGAADSDDQLYVTGSDGKIEVSYLKKSTTYEVSEVETVPGYNLNTEVIEFTIDANGQVDGKGQYEILMSNQPNGVHVSKTDITTSQELPGAQLVITDENGKIIDEWTSTTEEHVIDRIPAGKYTLTEKTAPDGYEVENSIEFEVQDSTVAQKVTMEDSPYREVVISKTDITDGAELPGATLTVRDAANKVVESWVSTEETHTMKLPSGLYTLEETIPATGYATATKITFEVVKTTAGDYAPMHVEMKDERTKVSISKKDVTTGEELPGATLIIKDSEGNTVEEWVSTDEPHYIEKLPIGKYTLTEVTAPDGYECAETITFEVKDTGDIQQVEMFDAPYRDVEISKKDLTNKEELPGASLVVKDSDGNVIDEWVSTEEAHKMQLPAGKYTLTETKPADGYITAETIDFEVLSRATANDTEVQKVEMYDDVTKVEISKQDITTKKELPGAKLEIKDEDNKVVESWTSTSEPHYIEKLPIGKYTLTETAAPDGYEVSESVAFEVTDTDIVQKVVMYDAATPTSETNTTTNPQTGDNISAANIAVIVIAIAILIGLGVFFILKSKKKNK